MEMKFELSVSQKELWTLGDHACYYSQMAIRISAGVDVERLEACIGRVIDDNEALASRCFPKDHSIFPFMGRGGSYSGLLRLREMANSEIHAVAMAEECFGDRYNAYADEALKSCLIRLKDGGDLLLVLRIYALWADAHSCRLVYHALRCHYMGERADAAGDDRIGYYDFSQWQNDLAAEPETDALKFWKKYGAISQEQVLPFGRKHGDRFVPRLRNIAVLTGKAYSALKGLAGSLQGGMSVVLLSRFGSYLRTFCESDVIIGYEPAHRNYRELDATIGMISRLLPVRIGAPLSRKRPWPMGSVP